MPGPEGYSPSRRGSSRIALARKCPATPHHSDPGFTLEVLEQLRHRHVQRLGQAKNIPEAGQGSALLDAPDVSLAHACTLAELDQSEPEAFPRFGDAAPKNCRNRPVLVHRMSVAAVRVRVMRHRGRAAAPHRAAGRHSNQQKMKKQVKESILRKEKGMTTYRLSWWITTIGNPPTIELQNPLQPCIFSEDPAVLKLHAAGQKWPLNMPLMVATTEQWQPIAKVVTSTAKLLDWDPEVSCLPEADPAISPPRSLTLDRAAFLFGLQKVVDEAVENGILDDTLARRLLIFADREAKG